MKNNFYVIIEDNGEFRPYNILPYLSREWSALRDIDKTREKGNLSGWVDRTLKYQFWGRCQYEMILSSWPPSRYGKESRKVDIYWQSHPNLPIITRLFAENEGIS